MGLTDFFKPVDTMTPDEVRAFLDRHKPDDYILVDVRQPKEYERGHIPGSRLIPLADLPDHLGELDPKKLTIAY
jgi:rhodanese-related sulfurtransferase